MPNGHRHKHHRHRHKHRRTEKLEPSKISIFNKVDINLSPRSSQSTNDESRKEDGCVGCFKSLFKSLRKS